MKRVEEKNNLIPHIMCVVLSICLWLYVMSEQNPIIERNYVVNLEQRNLTTDMMVFNAPEHVAVKVRGNRLTLSDLNPANITAYINMDGLKAGQHTLGVMTNFTQGEVVDVSPKTVHLYLDVSKEKTLPVEARVVGVPGQDLTLGKRNVTPKYVQVTGPAHRVDAVTKVIAPVDMTDRNEDFTAHVNMIAMDASGSEITEVTIVPSQAAVEAKVVQQLVTVELPIDVKLSGTLQPGLQLGAVDVLPRQIKATGSPSVLERMERIQTETIDLGTVKESTNVQVPLIVPEGVLVQNRIVEIRISILKNVLETSE